MKVEKLDNFGRGIVRINNKICFVNNAIDGEDVEIKKIKENSKVIEAIVTKYISKSKDRVIPKCKYYDICGGCSIAHMSYEKALLFKKQKVKEIFLKFAGIDINPGEVIHDKQYNYRNKIILHVKKNTLGTYKEKTNEIVEIDKCLLVDEKINKLISILKNYVKEESNIKTITIKLGNDTNSIMLIIDGIVNSYDKLLNEVDVLIINDKVITKDSSIISYIGNKKYKISKNSFFQVNKVISKKIYDEVLNNVLKLNSKYVLDLYCGTGTIGIYISDYVTKVLGIEVVSDGVKDANENKKLNNVKNIHFIEGKVEDIANNIDEDFDTVIVDPPRSGLHKNVIQTLERIKPENIIYVSCNPVTLARDIKLLNNMYSLDSIKLYDMFPNTYHCESVTVLERR